MKKSEVRLTQLASAAGCGAKIGPKVLAQVVGKLPKFTDPMLLVGPETSDDAAVSGHQGAVQGRAPVFPRRRFL